MLCEKKNVDDKKKKCFLISSMLKTVVLLNISVETAKKKICSGFFF